jgi:hypothetical protein
MWIQGEPKTPGYYLLEFSGGDRFVVVNAFIDDENVFRMEEVTYGPAGYVEDTTDVITQHLPIPKPLPKDSPVIQLKLGMTKAQVRELLGPPDNWGGVTNKYKEPCIWLYEDLQLTFWVQKYRTPYPGPELIGVRDLSQTRNEKEFADVP